MGFEGRCGGTCKGKRNLQDARYESGLDNAPIYDGVDGQQNVPGGPGAQWYDYGPLDFNATTNRANFFDAGMTGLHAMDSAALAHLADAIGQNEHATIFKERHRVVSDAMQQQLWDEHAGTFSQRFSGG